MKAETKSPHLDLLKVYKNEQWATAGNIPDENGNWLIWDKVNREIIGSAKTEGMGEMMAMAPELAASNIQLREDRDYWKGQAEMFCNGVKDGSQDFIELANQAIRLKEETAQLREQNNKLTVSLQALIYDLEVMKKGRLFINGSIVDLNLTIAKAALEDKK